MDSTPGILAHHAREGRVRVFREEAATLDQAPWVTRMARIAAVEHDADWILHSDADEFWFVRRGSAKVSLNGRDHDVNVGDVLHVPRTTAYQVTSAAGGFEYVALRVFPTERHTRIGIGGPSHVSSSSRVAAVT